MINICMFHTHTHTHIYIHELNNLNLQNQTLIAIKAPHGTTLEVPDPDEVGSKGMPSLSR
jgi:hypothetical protein